MIVNIAHSPDSDDFYMFWAIREKRLALEGFEFTFNALDTEQLNRAALAGTFDIIAISAAIYPRIQHEYLVLPYGASVGRNYGPKVVAKTSFPPDALNALRIAIPGETTTSCLLLRQIAPQAELITYPIAPYEIVFSALERGDVDAALLIHEGQLSYRSRGLAVIVDLGKWWHETTSLPLPLGLNAIARRLGKETIAQLSQFVSSSLHEALDHPTEVIRYLRELNKTRGIDFATSNGAEDSASSDLELKEYLAMYANHDSLQMTADTKAGLERLLSPLYSHSQKVVIDYAEE